MNALVTIFGLDEGELRTRLTSDKTRESQYQIVKKQVSMDDKKAFEDYCSIPDDTEMTREEIQEKNNIQGVWFEEDYLRVYPYNELACDTLGFTFSRDTADYGIEGYYNSSLTGIDGRQYGYFSDDSNVEQTIIEASDGNSLELSLDLGTQQIVEKWVNAFKKSTGAKNIGVIVEDPSSGEILAMDGGDRYDLNDPRNLSSLYSADEIAEGYFDAPNYSATMQDKILRYQHLVKQEELSDSEKAERAQLRIELKTANKLLEEDISDEFNRIEEKKDSNG